MQTPIWIPITSAIISVIAATLALRALWRTHFAKRKFIAIVGTLRLHIYPIKNEGRRWFIASFDSPVSVANEGARPGKILGLRLLVRFPELPIPDNRECFYAKWEVDANQICRERTSFSYQPEGALDRLETGHPPDLHKYTGSKEPIPERGLGAGPSYLDFPGSRKSDK